MEEDKLLIQSWLNISKDAVVGIDQKVDSFLLRIRDNYNTYCGHFKKREARPLKSRWHRLNAIVQKFEGCYKEAKRINKNKSGIVEKDILADAYLFYSQSNKGKGFKSEHAWRLLRGEPKWKRESMDMASKRSKNSESGTYTSSSNPATPIDCEEYDPASPMVRPMGQKAAKRKGKEKVAKTTTDSIDLTNIENAVSQKNIAMIKIAEAKVLECNTKKAENIPKLYEILMKDTSEMNESQRRDHELYCNVIRQTLGLPRLIKS